jgi:hypothetical protein
VGANQLRTLAWSNVDTIGIRFSEAVSIGQSALSIVNSPEGAAAPSVSGFSWNGATLTATWTFASTLQAGKYVLHLGPAVVDVGGTALDGEWTTGVSTDSGDGTPGGDFNFRFNVLPGDFDGTDSVTFGEIGQARLKLGITTAAVDFNYRQDMDGTGAITFGELGQARLRLGTAMSQFSDPTAPVGGPESEPENGPELFEAPLADGPEASPAAAPDFGFGTESFSLTASLFESSPILAETTEGGASTTSTVGGSLELLSAVVVHRPSDVLERALAAWVPPAERALAADVGTAFAASVALRRTQVGVTATPPTTAAETTLRIDNVEPTGDAEPSAEQRTVLGGEPLPQLAGEESESAGEPGRFARRLAKTKPWRRA